MHIIFLKKSLDSKDGMKGILTMCSMLWDSHKPHHMLCIEKLNMKNNIWHAIHQVQKKIQEYTSIDYQEE